MVKNEISNNIARQLVLDSQLLDGSIHIGKMKEGIIQVIDRLGYVQIDTIAAVKRSHHHTLWTRVPNYNEELLNELQSKERRIFEYWGHAMSYLPMSDYRYSLPRMRNFRNPTHQWILQQTEKCAPLIKPIMQRIRVDGPLSAKDFTASSEKKGGAWWEWKPAKFALELLYWRGDLMISERQKFQKIYDLTERVLPHNIDTTMPREDELGQFFVRRALGALGIASEREIQKFMQPDTARDSDFQAVGREKITEALNNLIEKEEVTPIIITEFKDKVYYALSKVIENIDQINQLKKQVHFLSPFDNMIIQRDRTKQFFAFDYSLECYLPAPKRKYGYFVFPILWGANFVGRLDPKADRQKEKMMINNLYFETEMKDFDDFLPAFVNKLIAFARFNNCKNINVNNVIPGKVKAPLKSLLSTQDHNS
jgi:uncharacterized protein YcaQ